MISTITQLEKISNLIDCYLTKWGKAMSALYSFQSPERYSDFCRFLSTFIYTLKRAGCDPEYAWAYDSCRGCFNMILIVSACFRSDMNDVTETAQRLWSPYSPFPINFVAQTLLVMDSVNTGKQELIKIMGDMHFPSSDPQHLLAPHQRAFACSRIC